MNSEDISQLKKRILSLEIELSSIKKSLESLEVSALSSKSNSQASALETTTKKKISADDLIQERLVPIQEQAEKVPSFAWDQWEFLLGGNWIAKIGILAMLLAFGWFMDLAFRYEWIGDSGKIFFGLFAGFLFFYGGFYYSKQNYRILTPALIGSGGTILYITIFAAYRFYHFLTIVETFFYLTMINLLLVFLAKIARSEVIYFFGYIGAVLSPVMVSTGENSYQFLFIYLTLCNLLFLYASRNQKWLWAPLLVFLSNWIVLGVWMSESLTKSSFWAPFLYTNFICFLFLFRELFLEFNHSKDTLQSKILIVGSLFLAAIYASMILNNFYPSFSPHGILFIGFVAVFTLDRFQKKQGIDWNSPILIYVASALVMFSLLREMERSWLSLALLSLGSIYTLGYIKISSEKNNHIKIIASVLWILTLLRVIFFNGLEDETSKLILNNRFLIYILTTISLSYFFFQFKKRNSDRITILVFGIAAIAISALGFLWEIRYSINEVYWRSLAYSAVFVIYSAVFLILGFLRSSAILRRIGVVFALIILLKFIIFDVWALSLLTKIIAGFSIGLLLVVLGLFYEKFKEKVLGNN
ncbi:MAG: DUF2339 domain-containing protein [Leptospiraceae bacterium]|nr:DUF2339 domain-containing protein [Leptospiraceae bacterium]MCZ8347339.1 DUF2339 domain-containing protein [Leptospiraceae bacterium]